MILLSILLASSVAAASEIDDAATALVSDLALPSVQRFGMHDDLAVVVQIEGDLSRIIGGLVLSRLSALGASSISLIPPGPDADARAREAGAEWLLAIRGEAKEDALSLFAELRAIDRGIWAAAPDPDATMIVATGEHRASLSTIPKQVDPPPPARGDRPRLEGPAIRVQSLAEPVLALRACRLSDPELDDLVVLSPDALTVYALQGGRIKKRARHELAALPRHRTPARDPVGSIACAKDRIAFGHSGLAKGYVLRATASKKQLSLEPIGELDGIPIAALPQDRWLLAETEGGTSRYRTELRAVAGSEITKVTLEAPIVDAVAFDGEVPDGWRLVAVTADHQLVRFGERLTAPQRVGPSGAGISAFLIDGRPHVIATGAKRDIGRDTILLLSEGDASRPISIDGLVFATAVGRFRGPALDLVAASRANGRSDLFLLRVWEPR